jgi:hypothetical protein
MQNYKLQTANNKHQTTHHTKQTVFEILESVITCRHARSIKYGNVGAALAQKVNDAIVGRAA